MTVLDPSVLEDVPERRCTSCDRPGHANNEDRQCEFYGRARGQMAWALNHPDGGLGDTVPHISKKTRIRISTNGVEQTEAHRHPFWYRSQVLEIEVDGHAYHLGSASGDGILNDGSRGDGISQGRAHARGASTLQELCTVKQHEINKETALTKQGNGFK